MKEKQAGLYIHIPFCLSKCGYCSFYSIKSVNLVPEYIAALKKEIKYYGNLFSSFDTIYIGGGTPSLLASEQIAEIFKTINRYFKVEHRAEITMEVNPNDMFFEYLRNLRGLGVNRLSIGVQSFDDKILKFLGRRHSAREALSSIETARRAGFDNLGIDLIYGIRGAPINAWKNTLRTALHFKPEHLSCYQLSLDRKTFLHGKYILKNWPLPDENTERILFMITSEELESEGYMHYEVSNFARKDKFKSRHNQKYWRHASYLGLGPAAHSFLNNNRWWNKSSVKNYIEKICSGEMPLEGSESLSQEQLQLETLFLGLRTREGINLNLYKERFGMDLLVVKKAILDALIINKIVKIKDGFLSPTKAGMVIADRLALI